jgi:hypothetical protein
VSDTRDYDDGERVTVDFDDATDPRAHIQDSSNDKVVNIILSERQMGKG